MGIYWSWRGESVIAESPEKTVPTQAAKQNLTRQGVREGNISVLIPPFNPVEDRKQRRSQVRQALGLDDSHCLLLALGEMRRHAGHKYASWVHAIIRQMLPHVRLLMPGGGPQRESVRFFAGTTGYDSEVFLTEDRFTLEDCLSGADIALHLHERDSGVADLVAAMAAGLPIVASNTPDAMELLGDGAAMIAPAGDPRQASAAVLKLLDDPALAKNLGDEAARKILANFAPCDRQATLNQIHGFAGAAL